ncbi:MAG: hypothetical protein AAGA56_20805 [Myxococcota bacterium]
MANGVFFPQIVLDVLAALERVDVDGDELVLTQEGYRYTVVEAARITGEVTTGEDPRDLVGRVFDNETLVAEHGAEILGNSMLIEDSAYDVVPGLLGTPSGTDPGSMGENEALEGLQRLEEVEEAV